MSSAPVQSPMAVPGKAGVRPLKVAVNARLLHGPTLRGWNRYTVNLLAQLPALGVELFLYTDRPLHEAHLARPPAGSYTVRVAPAMRYFWWEQRWLPRQCAADQVDLLHTPFNFGLPWTCPCPRVLTLHDAIEQVYEDRALSWRSRLSPAAFRSRFAHWVARRRAEHIITVSEHAKSDLVGHLGLRDQQITVIHEAADERFGQAVTDAERQRIRGQYGLSKPYMFYVGGTEKRKNVPFLVRAFAASQLDGVELLLAGGSANDNRFLKELAESLGAGERVRFLGWVEDADLPGLYAEALGFVYPSEYEGFGLQLCEAMAAGCPTLAARAASLPEVLGIGGETFSLQNVNELVGLLQRLAGEPAYRAELVQRARNRARNFTWQRTAEQTVAVYRQVLGGA